ncbi:MAG: DNA translocase FtsK 4TM domain-containing protein [Crocinitomicaceae bacterium]|nr:DNA translocase FtsK 4TM domain-containing protein [Crocinitomicaceae bacterium]
MAVKNEFTSNTPEEPKKKREKKKSDQPKKKYSGKAALNKLEEKVDLTKARRITGIIFLVVSIYTFLACLSYFSTWQADQDKVINKGLFEFLFSDSGTEVSNWLGKFGAWISHLLIYRWFGIASFSFVLVFFVFGVYMLFKIRILPLGKVIAQSILGTVWTSIFLGFFSYKIEYLGGSFGFYINDWLATSVGKFGAFIFIAALFFIFLYILFEPNFHQFMAYLGIKKKTSETENTEANEGDPIPDVRIVNEITDEEIEEDTISETISFEEEADEELESYESELIIDTPMEDDEQEDEIEEEDIEDFQSSDDFQIEVAEEKDEELDDSEINKKMEEFGEYDPTLDLSSYRLPPVDLLVDHGDNKISVNKEELEKNKDSIVQTLSNYKIEISQIKATVGPTVTLYEIVPAPGVRISKIKNLEDDIALSLAALGIRIIAPIPGKGTVGIEVPNAKPDVVSMKSLIKSEKFQNSDYELPIVLGKTISNETWIYDLAKMPHLLIAGATGQGKSVGLNAILVSILYKKHPSQVKFVMVDPKKVELTLYNKIERHFLAKLPGEEEPIITDTSKVVATLNSLCIEMDTRYEMLKNAQCRNIKEYNKKFISRKLNPEKGNRYLPYIVVVVDEFADLIMTAGKEVEHPIARLAQLARAIGIHLIIATQRPSVNVITGTIKANFPARIAFRVMQSIDSRTILDSTGADQLIGRGDMLVSTGNDMTRIQCGFVDTPEVEAICDFIGEQRAYPDALLLPEYVDEGAEQDLDFDPSERDSMFEEAARMVVTHQQGSASLLQRKLKLGYNRAGRLIDQLEAAGIVGPSKGSKARDVLISDEMALDEFFRNERESNNF